MKTCSRKRGLRTRLSIKSYRNGIALDINGEPAVVANTEKVDDVVYFLYHIAEEFWDGQLSRRSEERIHIKVFPGDKADEKFLPDECPLCYQKIVRELV